MPGLRVRSATNALAPPANPEKTSPRVHEFITEDPYLVKEDVRLSQAENHLGTLAHVWTQMEQYLQEKGLGYRLTADLEFNAIPATYLAGTGYRQKVAFDIGLWASPPAPQRIRSQNLGSISWPEWGAPRLVLEVLSAQTEHVDRREKRQICRRMGVLEFWLFDPRKATRALEGWRLDAAGRYHAIEANEDGELDSEVLETRLRGRDYQLEWWDWDFHDWYSTERQERAEGRAEGHAEGRAEGRAEGHAEGRAEGRAEGSTATLVESLRGVARFYLDADRLDRCLAALRERPRADWPSVDTLMQAITSARAPADAAEAVLRGTPAAPPGSPPVS